MRRTVTRWLRGSKYLLVWPAIPAYRRRARRSLRWRIAGYNLATLVAGLATALVLVGVLAAITAAARNYAAEEPASDARAVANFLVSSGLLATDGAADEGQIRGALESLTTGELALYRAAEVNQFDVRPRQQLKGTSAIALVMKDGQVVSSSGYAGGPASQLVLDAVADGATSLKRLSKSDPGGGLAGVGAYPVTAGAVVVVEKREIQAPRGMAIVRAEIRPVVATVWAGTVIAAIPGAAVATALAIFAARSVGGRVRQLSVAAGELAAGDLSARAKVDGEDEVASLGASFNTMAAQLEQSMGEVTLERERAVRLLDANRQLVANVSHELRTPVALIRGQLEALAEEGEETPRIAMALREIDQLDALVSDLFALASAEAEAAALEATPFDAVACVREALAPMVDLARREAEVSLALELPGRALAVRGDPRRLSAVAQNLVRNGIRHTPAGGIVLVRMEAENARARMEVRDTGAGIAAADLPHVFERFYRGESSGNRESGGAGLGLAIAREFVESMGGAIEVASEPGEGAVFTVWLPLADTGS